MNLSLFTRVKHCLYRGNEEKINLWLKAGWKLLYLKCYYRAGDSLPTTSVVFGRRGRRKRRASRLCRKETGRRRR